MTLMDDLLNLYRVDAQVRGLRSRVDSASRFLAAQQRKLDEVNEQRAEQAARRKQHQARIHNNEAEIGSLNERIERLRGELNVASTNKEYTALLTEVNTLKAKRADFEAQVITEMEQVEALNLRIVALEEEIAERTRKRDQAQKELAERRFDVGERLAELEAVRAVAAAAVPHDLLDTFNDLADTFDGEAMAAIEVVDKRNREYACGACNIHVPFEKVSRLVSSCPELIRCNTCQRILYMQEEMRGSLAGKK